MNLIEQIIISYIGKYYKNKGVTLTVENNVEEEWVKIYAKTENLNPEDLCFSSHFKEYVEIFNGNIPTNSQIVGAINTLLLNGFIEMEYKTTFIMTEKGWLNYKGSYLPMQRDRNVVGFSIPSPKTR